METPFPPSLPSHTSQTLITENTRILTGGGGGPLSSLPAPSQTLITEHSYSYRRGWRPPFLPPRPLTNINHRTLVLLQAGVEAPFPPLPSHTSQTLITEHSYSYRRGWRPPFLPPRPLTNINHLTLILLQAGVEAPFPPSHTSQTFITEHSYSYRWGWRQSARTTISL